MSDYQYRAVDNAGEAVHGTMDAVNLTQLEQSLKDAGYWLIEAKPVSRERRKQTTLRVTRVELIEFCYAMRALLDAGVAINDALQALASEASTDEFRMLLGEVKLRIESGDSLSDALNRYPQVFSKQMTNLVKAGEYSGSLVSAFAETGRYLEWTEEIVSELKQVSILPSYGCLCFGFIRTAVIWFCSADFR